MRVPAVCAQLESSAGLAEVGLPAAVPEDFATDEGFLAKLHHALMEIEITEGQLVCPETQKEVCAYS